MDVTKKISMDDYMKDFIPTLENFCSKSPLQFTINYIPETGLVKLTSPYPDIEEYAFTVNPMKDKKLQIKEIKETVSKNYPVIFSLKKFPYSASEIESFVEKGVPIKDAMSMRKETYLPRYKIIRVHNRYNEIDVVDFKTRKLLKFKLSIPLVRFLEKLFNSSREDISSFFKNDTRFLHVIK